VVIATLAAVACADAPANSVESGPPARVRAGIEVLLTDSIHLVRGRRVGLVTNHTGIFPADGLSPGGGPSGETTGGGLAGDTPGGATPGEAADDPRAATATRSTIDALAEAPGVELVALYAPEHGIRGDEEAGETIESGVDARTGVPIHSVYGATRKPTPEMLEGVEVLVFDMQDVGARYYTYVYTMAYAMEAAGEAGIPFVVLDRPNPIRGDVVQGNVLDTAFATFVGLYPTPMRHGMTAAELARLYAGEFGIDVELHVAPMDGWRRDMTFDETGLPWVPPSPNIPSVESALAYPGSCLFEGTPLSVGRGTDRAFEWVGAPWLDGAALAGALEAYGIRGVRFEPATFTPTAPGDGKFDGETVHGVRLVPESTDYDAPAAAVAMLIEARRASGDDWGWRVDHFDRLSGTDALRLGLEADESLEELTASWVDQLAAFETLRDRYLIYR
jgi:uncharacterized protein YbbC (DUF1343 family)